MLEAGLRLFGFGSSYPLFVEAEEAPGYLTVNRGVIRRFMADESRTPNLWIRPVFFPRKKPSDTFRIVVQGGSTAEGFPYGFPASVAAMLQQRLQRTFPDRKVEVITTAMSAVNSYTLLSFTDEIIEQQPDAVVIYAGHNEYVGIMGVGTGFSVGRHRWLVLTFLRFKELRFFQLWQRVLASLTPNPEKQDGKRRTLMATIVREKQIPMDSDLYQRGLAQFRANLDAILSRYHRSGIPVFIGTLASNLRDQPPFIGGHHPLADVASLVEHFVAGQKMLSLGFPGEALAEFDKAVEIDSSHAGGHYGRGQSLDQLERFEEAHEAYLVAKDLDQLRFRAPEAVNDIIRELAAKQGAHLVEVPFALAAEARDGIVGKDLMLEHLHPNLRGYFLLADAFYQAMHAQEMIGPWTHSVSREQAWEVIPVTEVDRLYGEWRAEYLKSDWPFKPKKVAFRVPRGDTRVERIASGYYRQRYDWPEAMQRLLDHYRKEDRVDEAARVAMLLAEAFPFKTEAQITAAGLLIQAGRPEAEVYFRHALERASPSDRHQLKIASKAFTDGDRSEALKILAMLRHP